MYVFGFFYSIINTCSPCFQVLYFLYPRFPYSDSDCIPEHFPDRSADHKVGAAVHRRHRLVDQDQLMSSVIIDQSCRRIYSQGTAKQMLLYDEAPVYRLLPSGSEKIAPIAAISTGLWYENYREFAIAPEDLGALDKLIRRETDRLTGNLPQLHKNEERRPAPER